MSQFYSGGKGDKLVLRENYPTEIDQFLKEESRIIKRELKAGNYKSLVEIGCMDGRNTLLALGNNVEYLGIDLVKRYIEEARRKYLLHENKVNFQCCDSADLESVSYGLKRPGLAIFPFNSLGNHQNPEISLKAVKNSNLDLLIFTYQTNEKSREVRKDYYQNCGYNNIKLIKNGKGDIFVSDEGLETIAFSINYLNQKLRSIFDQVEIKNFSEIGLVAYCKNNNGGKQNGNIN